MSVHVVFVYDEPSKQWTPVVQDVQSDVEAKQAFNAVLLTCRDAQVTMEHKTRFIGIEKNGLSMFEIIPAI